MKLQSCQNCWFNGLQYGPIGTSVGFCARHRKVLNFADETTCGQHIRKDLGLSRSQEVSTVHANFYEDSKIVRISSGEEVTSDTSEADRDTDALREDAVGEAVVDFGSLNSKIESLSQLKAIGSPRSEVAMSSLGRAYVSNCVRMGGSWTSGIHLYWWTKRTISKVPNISVIDIRYTGAVHLSRQMDMTSWSLMMLKLSLLDDIIGYAQKQGDDVGHELGASQRAAAAVQDFDPHKLSKWLRRELVPALDARLDKVRYTQLAHELHRDPLANNQPS